MEQRRSTPIRNTPDPARTSQIVERLLATPTARDLSYSGLKVVAAIRLLAMCSKAGRDPLLELTRRFSCITTAKAFIGFADLVGDYWPEKVMVMRPCCPTLSHDEMTLAQLTDAALAGDRQGFDRIASGLIRTDRHDSLYDRATALVALMQ